eukprot:6985783-Pyramimonas_sp.AAC.1
MVSSTYRASTTVYAWIRLSVKALELGFPPEVRFLELQVCTAARTLATQSSFSAAFQPTHSVTQGLRS